MQAKHTLTQNKNCVTCIGRRGRVEWGGGTGGRGQLSVAGSSPPPWDPGLELRLSFSYDTHLYLLSSLIGMKLEIFTVKNTKD